jgi:hypothetical protein
MAIDCRRQRRRAWVSIRKPTSPKCSPSSLISGPLRVWTSSCPGPGRTSARLTNSRRDEPNRAACPQKIKPSELCGQKTAFDQSTADGTWSLQANGIVLHSEIGPFLSGQILFIPAAGYRHRAGSESVQRVACSDHVGCVSFLREGIIDRRQHFSRRAMLALLAP